MFGLPRQRSKSTNQFVVLRFDNGKSVLKVIAELVEFVEIKLMF